MSTIDFGSLNTPDVEDDDETMYRSIPVPDEEEDFIEEFMKLLAAVDRCIAVVDDGTLSQTEMNQSLLRYDTQNDEIEIIDEVVDLIQEENYHILKQSGEDRMEDDLDMNNNDVNNVGDLNVNGSLTLPVGDP